MVNGELIKQMKEWRHHLHMHPESAFEEEKTSDYVAKALEDMGYQVHRGFGKTGLVASLTAGNGGKTIGLRADMDCINMTETGEVPYKSQTPERMHACGHDGHTATLLGTAKLLMERKNFNGTVRFIFQPAEEPGKGAVAMMKDGLFEKFPIDEIYGLHNMPQLPLNSINTRAGGLMASEDNFVIEIKGRGGHASSPHLGIDPLVTAAEIILALQTVVSRNVNPQQSAVISCTELLTDGVRNAIPTTVIIKGDTRSFEPEVQKLLEERMRTISENICKANGTTCKFEYTHEFAPTYNWEENVEFAVEVAKRVVGENNVDDNCTPMMGSEDFGAFLKEVPGCFVFLGGQREDQLKDIPAHNSRYDYNDEILATGVKFFTELIETRLK